MLSCENLDGFVFDDSLATPYLEEQGWKVDRLPWTDNCDWSQYQAAVIRTTWDYTQHIEAFLEKMELVASQTKLINPLEVVRWNSKKHYLKDLMTWGVPCIPTEFEWPSSWEALFEKWQTQKIMVKPQIGANSDGTRIITPENLPEGPWFSQEPLVQPFLESVLSEGEFSFHFFNNEFSHAIRKVPKSGDYRVQEEHGGNILSITPTDDELRSAQEISEILNNKLSNHCLFMRIDLVRNLSGQLEVMEVELIEPALYFRTDKKAPANFARAFSQYMGSDKP